MNIGEKVAYLKGLAEGLELDVTTKNGKLISGILGVLETIAESVNNLESKTDKLEDYATDLDRDLGDVEEVIAGQRSHGHSHDHSHSHKHPGGDCSNSKPECHHKQRKSHKSCDCGDDLDGGFDDGDENESFEDFEDTMVQIKCPMCNDSLYVETGVLLENDVISCPNCDKPITIIQKDVCSGGRCCAEGRGEREEETDGEESACGCGGCDCEDIEEDTEIEDIETEE